MTSATAIAPPVPAVRLMGFTWAHVQNVLVWLMLASSFYVIAEPAPSDMLFILVLASFLTTGLSISTAVAPMILYLLLYNVGAFISFLQISGDHKAMMFVITSAYMAASAIFFAFYVAHNPLRHMAVIKNAWVLGAVMAAILGLLGYFNIAGLGAIFAKGERAYSSFKDPNVFSTFLILPGVMLVQGFLLGTQRQKVISLAGLLLILAALFLAFSRGAWISFVMSSALMVAITFVLTPSAKMRSRIIVLTIIGVIGVAILLAFLLSFEEARKLFLDRFTLLKDYDAGERGRFGNQLNSIPMLLQRPLGFGPLQFHNVFGLDPHNVFINSFSSYGWLGGLSYFMLIISTIIIGFKTILTRTPWQNYAIVVFCPLLTTIFQGVQIDTDHWRHFYWMLGLMWGLFAASVQSSSAGPDHRTREI